MSTRHERRVVAKTADYTINANLDSAGTIFTNAGAAGAVIFTLPAPSRLLLGHWYEFLGVADQDITVKPPTADTAIALNDLAADSLASSTSGQKIGSLVRAMCIKGASTYQWALVTIANGATGTVAT